MDMSKYRRWLGGLIYCPPDRTMLFEVLDINILNEQTRRLIEVWMRLYADDIHFNATPLTTISKNTTGSYRYLVKPGYTVAFMCVSEDEDNVIYNIYSKYILQSNV